MISNVAQIQRMFWIFKMDKNVGNVSLTVIFLCAIFGFSSCSLLVEVHSVRCMYFSSVNSTVLIILSCCLMFNCSLSIFSLCYPSHPVLKQHAIDI